MSDVPARALFHTAPRWVEIRELPTRGLPPVRSWSAP